MSQVLSLFRLQKIDTHKDQVLSRLKAIDQILQEDEVLRIARGEKQAADRQLHEARHGLREIEENARLQRVKIEQSEAALYGGTVKNPKELQDIQKEIASLKRFLSALEESEFDAMVEIENIEKDNLKLAENLLRVEETFATRFSDLAIERDRLRHDLERIDAERSGICGPIPADLIRKYEQMRSQRQGIAVAGIDEDSCAACGSELTPAERQSARSPTNICHCPSCGRFLYAG